MADEGEVRKGVCGMEQATRLTINGVEQTLLLEEREKLLSVLREKLGLTGAKYGCGEGACGACTVLLDGAPAQACEITVGELGGRAITTIEGLPAPLRPAFGRHRSSWCPAQRTPDSFPGY
jgi:aerobic-type carbon monoxide dehydrogenase small subunit (CoxS/CutS family)